MGIEAKEPRPAAGWVVVAGVAVLLPKKDGLDPKPDPRPVEACGWVVAGWPPNSELPVVVWPKMLLPAPVVPAAPAMLEGPNRVEPPKLPVDVAVAGVPLPIVGKKDMVAAGWSLVAEGSVSCA